MQATHFNWDQDKEELEGNRPFDLSEYFISPNIFVLDDSHGAQCLFLEALPQGTAGGTDGAILSEEYPSHSIYEETEDQQVGGHEGSDAAPQMLLEGEEQQCPEAMRQSSCGNNDLPLDLSEVEEQSADALDEQADKWELPHSPETLRPCWTKPTKQQVSRMQPFGFQAKL